MLQESQERGRPGLIAGREKREGDPARREGGREGAHLLYVGLNWIMISLSVRGADG